MAAEAIAAVADDIVVLVAVAFAVAAAIAVTIVVLLLLLYWGAGGGVRVSIHDMHGEKLSGFCHAVCYGCRSNFGCCCCCGC